MPHLSPSGLAVMGVANNVSIDGSIPAAIGVLQPTSGPWDWVSPTVAFGPLAPNFASEDFELYRYDTVGATLTHVLDFGANATYVKAGNGNWAAWAADGPAIEGLITNLPALGPFPAGYMLSVSHQGEFVFETSLIADSGIRIYSAAGVLIDQINGILIYNDRLFARDGVFPYALAGLGWRLRDYRTPGNLGFLLRNDSVDQMVPVIEGTDIWLLERNNIEQLTIRKKDDTTAWLVGAAAPNQYLTPDAILLSPGVARIAWTNTVGEDPDSLFVMDLNLVTGANDLATVVAGALVFVPQAPLGTIAVTGTLIPASSGGGGGGSGSPGSTSPGKSVLNQRARPTPAPRVPRRYPHVAQVKDFPTQQSLQLAWDQLGSQRESLSAMETRLAAQAETIAKLEATVATLTGKSNVAYKGVTEP